MVGRDLDELYPRSERSAGEPVLEVSALAPGHASFTLRRGEVLGIAGLVGAGRTRMLRTIFGLRAVQAGNVKVGTLSGAASPHDRWRQGLGFVSEDRGSEGLAAGLSVADNMTLSRLDGLGPRGIVWPRRQADAARRWIDRLRIKCAGPRAVTSSLSGGNQQKIAVARLLHHDVDVLLLDEPTRGIDVAAKLEIMNEILALARAGLAVLFISSEMDEVVRVSDRIVVLRDRSKVGELPGSSSEQAVYHLIAAGA
jgi:ribose transport system ATP-binding protein